MRLATISLKVHASGPGLLLTFLFDGLQLQTMRPDTEFQVFRHDFPDDTGSHSFEIQMSGKLPKHTTVGENGELINDTVVQITDISAEDTDIGMLFFDRSVYQHDFNGTGTRVQDKFHGIMGCNGSVKFEFESPVYLWFLENT